MKKLYPLFCLLLLPALPAGAQEANTQALQFANPDAVIVRTLAEERDAALEKLYSASKEVKRLSDENARLIKGISGHLDGGVTPEVQKPGEARTN